jgi:hypothetical protein
MRIRIWFSATLLLIVGIFLAESFALRPAARMAPLWALLPTLALLVLQVLVDASPRLRGRLSLLQERVIVPDTGGASVPEAGEEFGPRDRPSRELRLVFWLAWLMGLMYLVGLLPSTVLFLIPYLRSESGLGWGRSVVLTGVATAVIYVAFGLMARVPFPSGILF